MKASLFILCGVATACGGEEQPIAPKKEVPPVTVKEESPPTAQFEKFPTAAKAVQTLLARRPRVVGFGEYHSTIGGAPVVGSLTRFRKDILPAISGALSDIVVETWVEPSGCGKKAQQTAADVKETLQRPEQVETEVFTLLREARERKLGAHILEMSCADYASFRSAGKVDYDKPLSIVTKRLLAGIEKAIAGESPASVAVYGGTMHNDVHPIKGFGAYSYAPRIAELTENKYLEIDLFVPELIADSSLFVGQPWFEVAKKNASADHVLVITRGPSSYVIVLRRGVTLPTSP